MQPEDHLKNQLSQRQLKQIEYLKAMSNSTNAMTSEELDKLVDMMGKMNEKRSLQEPLSPGELTMHKLVGDHNFVPVGRVVVCDQCAITKEQATKEQIAVENLTDIEVIEKLRAEIKSLIQQIKMLERENHMMRNERRDPWRLDPWERDRERMERERDRERWEYDKRTLPPLNEEFDLKPLNKDWKWKKLSETLK